MAIDREPSTDVAPGAGCVSCGSPAAQPTDTTDGRLMMCPPCIALHDIGCP